MSFLWRGCSALRQVKLGRIAGNWEIDGGIVRYLSQVSGAVHSMHQTISLGDFEMISSPILCVDPTP